MATSSEVVQRVAHQGVKVVVQGEENGLPNLSDYLPSRDRTPQAGDIVNGRGPRALSEFPSPARVLAYWEVGNGAIKWRSGEEICNGSTKRRGCDFCRQCENVVVKRLSQRRCLVGVYPAYCRRYESPSTTLGPRANSRL